MMGRGAKNFAFISRSGTDKAEAAQLVESLKRSGASVEVLRADASNLTDVERVVSDLNAISPIRGVVHAAMVLQVTVSSLSCFSSISNLSGRTPSLNG